LIVLSMSRIHGSLSSGEEGGEEQTQPPAGSSSGKACVTGSKVYCCHVVTGAARQPLTTSNDWFPLLGQAVFDRATQHIAAVSRGPGNLDLFVIGFDNHVWSTFWTEAGGWNRDWFPLPGQAVFDRATQHIAAVSRGPGNLDLFVIGFDNHVWSTFWTETGGWNRDWFPLPGQAVFDRATQHIAAVSRLGNLDLFVLGFDNHAWSTFWTGASGWNADFFSLPGQAVFDRDKQHIAAVSRGMGNVDLFVLGFDNRAWTTFSHAK
jgi:hypothetical protein